MINKNFMQQTKKKKTQLRSLINELRESLDSSRNEQNELIQKFEAENTRSTDHHKKTIKKLRLNLEENKSRNLELVQKERRRSQVEIENLKSNLQNLEKILRNRNRKKHQLSKILKRDFN